MKLNKMVKICFLILFLVSHLFGEPILPKSSIEGIVLNEKTKEPVAWVDIYIHEINRGAATNKNGQFFIPNIPAGEYSVHFTRIGYNELHKHIIVLENDTTILNIKLLPNSFESEAIVIEDHSEHSHLQEPDLEINNREMGRKLGTTLAETIKDLPGLEQQTNGPAPARPVLRGLSGDRLLLLENGKRPGDLSTTAADHAVTIEPVTAERLEVIRGPLALAYGTNTTAGVINVVRNVSSKTNHQINGAFSAGAESVNSGIVSSLNLNVPLNDFYFYGDGSFRKAANVNTPSGALKNTSVETGSGKAELSWQPLWGLLKSSFAYYQSDYGIPPSIPELGHPNGIDISLNKNTIQLEGLVHKPIKGLNDLQIEYDLTNYFHEEFTSTGRNDAAFSLTSQHLSFKTSFEGFSIFQGIKVGSWFEHRDYKSGGLTNTVNSIETSMAGWIYQENDFGPLKTSAALRLENKTILPEEEKVDLRVGNIRKRSFTDYAASLKAQFALSQSWLVQTTLLKAFRAPGIEELFSDGPHLASYAYEVGNADLNPEKTYGAEIGISYDDNLLYFNLTGYFNRIDGYLFSQNTGERSWKRNDLFRYKMVGLDSEIKGVEAITKIDISGALNVSVSASFIEGNLLENFSENDKIIKVNEPLPFMPPFKGSLDITYKWNPFSIIYSANYAADQDRPGRFEKPTKEYLIHGLNIDFFIPGESLLHTFSFTVQNATDETYRRHLNRIKDIFPEAGRNFKLFYKLYF
ncbi:MAG: TonB-dependent receptor [Calditrichaeota bacterium]|nr:TonB-dependent receptor [Calditrichota bacterium]